MACLSLGRNLLMVLVMLVVGVAIAGCAPADKSPDYTQQIIDHAAADKGLPGEWSKPSNGLIGRIEAYHQGFPEEGCIFLRLKNVSDKRLNVRLTNRPGLSDYQVGFLSSSGWKTAPAYAVEESGGLSNVSNGWINDIYLQSGEDALIFLMPTAGGYYGGQWPMVVSQYSVLTVVMDTNASPPEKYYWSGRLELPAVMMHSSTVSQERPHLPNKIPPLSPQLFMGGNLSGNESLLVQMSIYNKNLLGQLETYSADEVRKEMVSQMWAQHGNRDIQLALLYATMAADRGSEEGKQFILQAMKSNDIETVRSALSALDDCSYSRHQDARKSNWAKEACKAALKDQRPVLDPYDLFRTAFSAETTNDRLYGNGDDGKPIPYKVAELAEGLFHGKEYNEELPATSPAASQPVVDVSKMIDAISTGKTSNDVCDACYELGRAGTPQAVAALIGAFSIDFSKRERNTKYPEDYHETITYSLREATGQPFGNDPAVWRAWWTQKGCKMQKFK